MVLSIFTAAPTSPLLPSACCPRPHHGLSLPRASRGVEKRRAPSGRLLGGPLAEKELLSRESTDAPASGKLPVCLVSTLGTKSGFLVFEQTSPHLAFSPPVPWHGIRGKIIRKKCLTGTSSAVAYHAATRASSSQSSTGQRLHRHCTWVYTSSNVYTGTARGAFAGSPGAGLQHDTVAPVSPHAAV